VIVVADLPGVEKENVAVRLIDPQRLEIVSVRSGETEEGARDFFVRERIYGQMSRTVMLPPRWWRRTPPHRSRTGF
jgi:HSP20 family protein